MVILFKLFLLSMDSIYFYTKKNADNKNQHCFIGEESILNTVYEPKIYTVVQC